MKRVHFMLLFVISLTIGCPKTQEPSVATQTTECEPGSHDYMTCGMCGTSERLCSAESKWLDWGPCEDEGVCSTGTVESCCGEGKRTCNERCNWEACNKGECTPGAFKDTEQTCGNCGVSRYMCNEGCGWEDMQCDLQGECAPGYIEQRIDGGYKERRECSAECSWNEWVNEPEPVFDGSTIMIVARNKPYFGVHELSNGEQITEEKVKAIQLISSRSRKNRVKIAEKLLKLNIEHDDVEDIYFIDAEPCPCENTMKFYIGLDKKKTWLSVLIQYYGDDLLFIRSFKVAADDYRWQSPVYNFTRDIGGGQVWEFIDIEATPAIINAGKKLAAVKQSVIRFQGRDYYSDYELSNDQKRAIIEINELFALLKGTPV